MVLVSDLITQVRDITDEPNAAQWSNDQLGKWINEGARDLARSTRHLKGNETIPVVDGTATYNLSATTIAVEHVYYLPGGGDTRAMPLIPKHYESMDSVWGMWQNRESTYPQWYTVMGMSPTAQITLYPVPSANASLSLIVSKLPTEIAIPVVLGATADVPALWYDAIVDYCEFKALRRDRDQRWQEAFDQYTAKRDGLMNNVDFLAINREMVPTPHGTYMDRWLVDPDWD